MKSELVVDAGICGFRTTVHADSPDGQFVALDADSDCDKIRDLAESLKSEGPFDAFQEINPAAESAILEITRSKLKGCCAGCIVPVAFFKAMQTAAGLALPADISVSMKTS